MAVKIRASRSSKGTIIFSIRPSPIFPRTASRWPSRSRKISKRIEERHLVTPFNAKAMALFPERIGGKVAALITVNTDRPPAKICLALFDEPEDMWSKEYWDAWYKDLDAHVIDIERNENSDQIEVGSAPLKTKDGWLIFYSYIYNYFSPPPIFGIQAALLDLKDPQKIVGEVKRPFIVPQEEYEFYGRVPHIVFPSGALIKGNDVHVYYGAADTTSCVATFKKNELLEQLVFTAKRQLQRFEGNPIITPIARTRVGIPSHIQSGGDLRRRQSTHPISRDVGRQHVRHRLRVLAGRRGHERAVAGADLHAVPGF